MRRTPRIKDFKETDTDDDPDELVAGVMMVIAQWERRIIGVRTREAMAEAKANGAQFGRLVALGISCNFFLYVFVNIAMVMGAIPVGGVPLPLVSHGGSALLTVMVGFGVLMSVHVHRDVAFANADDDG